MTTRARFAQRYALASITSLLLMHSAEAQPPSATAGPAWFVQPARSPLTLEGNAAFGVSDPRFDSGRLAYDIPLRAKGDAPARLQLGVLVGTRLPREAQYGRLDSRLFLGGKTSSVWLGLAARKDDVTQASTLFLPGIGAAMRLGAFAPSAGLEQTPDVVTHTSYFYSVADTGWIASVSRESIRRATAHAGLAWSRGRVTLESAMGLSVSHAAAPQSWVRGNAAVALVSGLSLVAAVGSKAPDLFGTPESHRGQATLGFRLTSWSRAAGRAADAPEWRILHEGEGWYTIEVRARGAGSVEITSDATEWVPTLLQQGGGDWWHARLHLEPGVYHINIRIDGGPWMVPPGAPTATDDLVGNTGVIVIEK